MKLSAPPPPPPPPSDGNPGAGAPGAPDEQPNPTPAPPPAPETAPTIASPPAEPAPAPAPRPAVWPAWYSGVDSALVGLVVAFALASASFVARNSDVWLHLAAGKRLFAGEYLPGGSDPLSYSAAGRTWVNHSWLTDAGAYLLYGGTGQVLVAAKAVLVALAFGLLIGIRRPNFALWPWAATACVAVLACAPQFTLRPLVVSMLLCAVTLFVLFRMPRGKDHPKRFLIAVGVTFWVWANADQWFFVGPLMLALLVVGELVQKYGFNSPDEPDETPADEPLGRLPNLATLAKALGVGVLVCTLTPHHVRVWELPFELLGAPGAEQDARLRNALFAPIDGAYVNNAALGYNANGLAYAVLFTAGATLFGLGPARVRAGHVALWLGLAALSLVSVYAVPFFALAAVPLVAAQLNAYSARAQLKTWGDPRTRLLIGTSSAGRLLSVVAVCALLVLAYPGWVHPDGGNPVYARRLALGVEPDPALVRAAEQFQAWRADGGLPDDARGLVTNIDLANYLAWFAPKEKVFINGRFRHHRPEIADYLAVRKGLGLLRMPDEEPNAEAAAAVLKARGAEYVAVHAGPGEALLTRLLAQFATQRLYQQWGEWSAWYLDGRTAVFGWRGDDPKASFAGLAVDPVALAFGPKVEKVPAPELAQPLKEVDPLVEAFGRAPRGTPAGAAEALGWLEYKEALQNRLRTRQRLSADLFFHAPAVQHTFHYPVLIGADIRGGTAGQFPARGANPGSRLALQAEADALRAVPLLAVRAARRAVAENPDHPDGYFALGLALGDPDLPFSESERALGRITAFRQCLIRLPRPERYRRGQFATTATDAALNLAQTYLGTRLPWRDARGKEVVDYTGFPITVSPFQGAFGQPLFGERNGSVSRGQGSPSATVLANGTPYILAIDVARETLQTALEYAPLDLAGEADDRLRAKVKQVEDFRRDVEDVVIRYKGRFDASVAGAPKLPTVVDRAIQNCMLGEALKRLGDKDADLEKEYGKDHLGAALQLVALELVLGRVEDAAEHLKVLGGADLAGALDQTGAAAPVQRLKYQKAVLAGEYKLAGEVWETLAPRVGQFEKLPPPGPTVPEPLVLGALQAVTGTPNPKKLLYGLFVPPVGLVPEPAQLVEARFWMLSCDVPRQVLQQSIAQQLQGEMSYFARRGVLYLLEGNVPAAKERFKDALRKAPAGWDVPNINSAEADMYLKLIEKAEQKGPR